MCAAPGKGVDPESAPATRPTHRYDSLLRQSFAAEQLMSSFFRGMQVRHYIIRRLSAAARDRLLTPAHAGGVAVA